MSVRGWGETREVHESMRGIDKIDSQNIFPRWKCERLISLALRSEGISLKEMRMAICFLKEISRCLEYSARGGGETDTIVALKKFFDRPGIYFGNGGQKGLFNLATCSAQAWRGCLCLMFSICIWRFPTCTVIASSSVWQEREVQKINIAKYITAKTSKGL